MIDHKDELNQLVSNLLIKTYVVLKSLAYLYETQPEENINTEVEMVNQSWISEIYLSVLPHINSLNKDNTEMWNSMRRLLKDVSDDFLFQSKMHVAENTEFYKKATGLTDVDLNKFLKS